MWGHSKKADTHKLRREAKEEVCLASALLLDFQAPELWEN